MSKTTFSGVQLLKGTAVAILATVALVGFGFIANGLYMKAKVEVAQLRVSAAPQKDTVRYGLQNSPPDQGLPSIRTISI